MMNFFETGSPFPKTDLYFSSFYATPPALLASETGYVDTARQSVLSHLYVTHLRTSYISHGCQFSAIGKVRTVESI